MDPPFQPPTEQWQRRLDSYARKCAGQLEGQRVPRFRSAYPRHGIGTFVDAFWMLACDVDRASRAWVENDLHRQQKVEPGFPPLAAKGQFVGDFRGDALLLSASGVLCHAKVEGFFPRTGGMDNRCMDVSFSPIARDRAVLASWDWGWYNCGRWRQAPRNDITAYGLRLHSQSIEFTERYNRGNAPYAADGGGTSAALSAFVKNGGQVRWPRHFHPVDY